MYAKVWYNVTCKWCVEGADNETATYWDRIIQ